MGLFDRVTANVLKRVVAKFVLEKRPAPKRNELLEGPRIPGAFGGVLCAAEQVFLHDRDRSLLTDTRTHLKRPQITSCCDENTEFLCGGCPILTTTYERWSLNPQKWAPILARQLARGRYVCFACFQSNIHSALTLGAPRDAHSNVHTCKWRRVKRCGIRCWRRRCCRLPWRTTRKKLLQDHLLTKRFLNGRSVQKRSNTRARTNTRTHTAALSRARLRHVDIKSTSSRSRLMSTQSCWLWGQVSFPKMPYAIRKC